jgi:hypothetical protein
VCGDILLDAERPNRDIIEALASPVFRGFRNAIALPSVV